MCQHFRKHKHVQHTFRRQHHIIAVFPLPFDHHALSKRTVQYWLWYKIFSSCSNGSIFDFNHVLCSHFEVESQIPSALVPFYLTVDLSQLFCFQLVLFITFRCIKTALLHAHSLPLKSFHQFQFKNAHFVFLQFARSLVLSWLCFSQATCLKNNRNLFFRPPAVFCLHYSAIPCCSQPPCYDFFFVAEGHPETHCSISTSKSFS